MMRRKEWWIITGVTCLLTAGACGGGDDGSGERQWWEKPGFGVMYQLEFRPGMDWDRDFVEFNRSMMDADGNLDFNGPFAQVDEWIEISRDIGLDYHIMEVKWHDGICYFNTALTDWKTDTDYAARFAELSREAEIPFLYYYSAIFDHNPQFDDIQPDPHQTFSVISQESQPRYEEYLRGQYRELMEQYQPDGMWIDWFWFDTATPLTIDFFNVNYPDAVLAFNASNYNPLAHDQITYTSGEAHGLEGPATKVYDFGTRKITVFESAWYWANANRENFDHPWELVGPAGVWWNDPTARDDFHELVRMVAVVLASGGKYAVGAAAQMDGSIFPDHVTQLEILGEWYQPRKGLFTEAEPLRYEGDYPEGVTVDHSRFRAVASRYGDDRLLHLVNFDGQEVAVEMRLSRDSWEEITGAYIEPEHRQVDISESGSYFQILLNPADVDPVDTIIRLTGRFGE